MQSANVGWGAPRIHGELLKLGIEIAEATFRVLYVLLILHHERRHVVHFNVTRHPTSIGIAQQLVAAFPFDTAPRYLVRDREGKYGKPYRARVRSLGIKEVVNAPRSPWRNPFIARVVGSIRRDCLDHVVVLNERHLRRILGAYPAYYKHASLHTPFYVVEKFSFV